MKSRLIMTDAADASEPTHPVARTAGTFVC